jgi:hypothetical protein
MGSDRARVSYDPSRHWRGVINQQGRVTLEADWNEAGAIAAEEDRAQLVDVIGPSGTPDDGYRVIPVTDSGGTATGDLTIQKGTLYVGGERMVLDADLDYAKQPTGDWVDWEGDPLWVDPAAVLQQDQDEAVYLLLREQEVGAVEDPSLLDIALGGPDTSERLRIVQRVVRGSTGSTDCSGALGDLEASWAKLGLEFDPATMRLDSVSSLQVSFQQGPTAATPCEPVAQGGYLGAENQLIRVQVSSVDVKTGAPTLVWGFDNAYFLYRIAHCAADQAGGTTTLTLASAPVDSYHQPTNGQAVEVLEAAAELTASDFVAATTGIVTTVATAYNPDDQELVIATALAAPTTNSPLLFLRVWQDTIAYTGAGPVALGDTGLQVTLTSSTGVYHVGDYWMFAARPGTPTMVSPVYPERILDAPQPPDGPRLWACQLAVVAWSGGTPTVSDCRHHFPNLTSLGQTDCCCVDVSADDVDGGATLQALIDKYASLGPTTICLQSGTYTLPAPLVISAGYSNLTIQGCGNGGVVLAAAEGPPETFLLGLILLDKPVEFTLRGIDLAVPLVQFSFGESAVAGVPQERQPLLAAYGKELALSIGVYVLGGTDVTIEDCTFQFEASNKLNVFGAGVFATRAVRGIEVVDCSFTAAEAVNLPFSRLARGSEADPPYQVRFGYLQVPTRAQDVSYRPIVVEAPAGGVMLAGQGAPKLELKRNAAAAAKKAAANEAAAAAAAKQIGVPSLRDAVIERNVFDGLTLPVLVIGRVGTVRIEENTVRSSYGGFWLISAGTTVALSMFDRVGSGIGDAYPGLVSSRLTSLADPVLLFASVLGRILPLTPPSADPTSAVGEISVPDATGLGNAKELFGRLYSLSSGAKAAVTETAKLEEKAVKDVPVGKAVSELPPQISGMFENPGYDAVGDVIPEADPGTALVPRLDVSANQVDAVVADADTGAGLLVIALDTTSASSLVCTGNRFRSRVVDGATVSLWALVECTFTGNIVSNEIADAKNDRSIVLEPELVGKVPAVAVTGNVLIGPVTLPARPLAAPFNHWNPLNTVLDYISP